MKGFIQFRLETYAHGISNTIQWIDGSFVEDKLKRENAEPNDIDVVTFVNMPQHIQQVKQSNITETYLTMDARLSGIFTDSGTFEFVDNEGHRRIGNTAEDLDDEQLTEYARIYTNQMCKLVLKEYRETPNHGKPKAPTYELLQIQDI